jgi:molybdate transport system substrate-binding protein
MTMENLMQSPVSKRFLAAAALLCATGASLAADITVSAASSLTNAFREIAQGYEAQHPGSKVALNFGASGALLQQMSKGAPVDVFASADQETMDMALQQGLVKAADRRDFVRNTLVLIVPADSSSQLTRLADLAQPAIKRIAIGIPASVPVGRYTRHALETARLWTALEPKAINTQNVRQSLDYVARGEVDAGFVYATDAALMKDKVRVAFEVPLDIAISYPIARTAASVNAADAERFVSYVLSPAGQAVLARFGFRKP